MAKFWDLPRELRDMIYLEVLLWQRSSPSLPPKQFMLYDPNTRFQKVYEPQSYPRGEFGCAYALEKPPSTCASFLACNRQVNAEMGQCLEMLRKKGEISLKLDCIAEDESWHYFTWIGIPLVSTKCSPSAPPRSFLPDWLHPYLPVLLTPIQAPTPTTRITRLQIDIRITGSRAGKWLRNTNSPDRTGWAICAALKRLLDKGPNLHSNIDQHHNSSITIDELILNVVPSLSSPFLYSPTGVAQPTILSENFPLDLAAMGTVHPQTVARELVDTWGRIWAGEEGRGALYVGLLEKVGWVKVCVEGKVVSVREGRGVLERGRRESRMIAERLRW